ncbi:hypothetical protein ATO10_15240 [Actibacterium atlanticum]|uniref:DUF6923 domain-containing protein n=1 Tax=Actibacterium atlanticum TaxID=1461693 RepID=A0A058ZJA2_9RHOB|nr:hypothetical protein [Actibacterium atlanticum]KCV80886.1 hypothetical protein ATO10_15240 [Actibacterium atlanticum]
MAVEDQDKFPENTGETIVGSDQDDVLTGGADQDQLDGNDGDDTLTGDGAEDHLLGGEGSDTIDGGEGNDLAAGDYVGEEWTLVDGKWVYDPSKVQVDPELEATGDSQDFNDTIVTGEGDDVLLGNRGHDDLSAGAGDDIVNAGTGNDTAKGGEGEDVINLEDGDDTGYGGLGADVVNAGDGDDIVYGDQGNVNLLGEPSGDTKPTSISQFSDVDGWAVTEENGQEQMATELDTKEGETYTIAVDLAANLAADSTSGSVQVIWNGEVVETISTTSGAYETYTVEVTGTGGTDQMIFRVVDAEVAYDGPEIDTSGAVYTYETTIEVNGQEVTVDAIAPGQSNLYQVIDGQLMVFDPEAEEYITAGSPGEFKVNAIGYNVEDDLIYGIGKGSGQDALGNEITPPDLVVMDANGDVYRLGDVDNGDYVGDFDSDGNLWTFNSSLNRITMIDVDQLDENGDPVQIHYDMPKDLFDGRLYDIAYNADENCFYAVEAPSQNGGNGQVHKIDLSEVQDGGLPTITSIPVTGTLFEGEMESGMVKGAYGAVFMDGDGNLYIGLNKGDHDLDGTTDSSGAVYQVHYDFDAGYGYAEFKSEAQNTGSNDGAVDPRSIDPFAVVDTEATILLKDPVVTTSEGGDDDLRGGAGDDIMYGEAGDDILSGGEGTDTLDGGEGADNIGGDGGADTIFGGAGDDQLRGGEGVDSLDGGDGNDMLFGGEGTDTLIGGAGNDHLEGGAGDDSLDGGEGNDALYGGDGNDFIIAGAGDDSLNGQAGNDTLFAGDGTDYVAGNAGDDTLDGGAGDDKLVGGTGADVITGGAGNDHMWGGEWSADGSSDTFIVAQGGGKDMVHDFESNQDIVDLSAYGLEYADLEGLMDDQGWATVIDLSGLEGGQEGDKLILKSVSPDDLDESNFIL